MARQATDRRFLEAIASDCEAAGHYVRRVLKEMEASGVESLWLHAGMLERVYMPGVIAFATDALAQVAAESVAKHSGTKSPAVREMERVVTRRAKKVSASEAESEAQPEPTKPAVKKKGKRT